MAEIKHNQIGDVDVSGASFVQQSSAVAETFAPDVLKFLGQTGLDQFKQARLGQARGEAKSLLEELTGNQATLQIAKDEADLFSAEQDLAVEFASFEDQDSEAAQLTRSQLLGLQEQKEMLSKQREAVVQGLLTEEQYRKKAEMSFYTQVALTPGIRDELAAVMSEHLGIDPRGQTAKITLDARKALKDQTDRSRNKQIDLLTARGMWHNQQSEQANINQFWPLYQREVDALKNISNLEKQLALQENIDSAETKGAVEATRTWISEGMPLALTEMGRFNGRTVHSMTLDEINSMDDQTKQDWLDTIDDTRNQFLDPVSRIALKTGEKFEQAFTTMNNRADDYKAIISGQAGDELTAANLKRLQNKFITEVEMEKARLIYNDKEITTLAALGDILAIETLLPTITASMGPLVRALRGSRENLKDVEDQVAAELKHTFKTITDASTRSWEDGTNNKDDAHIANLIKNANTIANQDPEDIGEDAIHLFRLGGSEGFIARAEEVDPANANKMKAGIIRHQRNVGASWNADSSARLAGLEININNERPLQMKDFHIKRVGGDDASWLVSMNTEAENQMFDDTMSAGRGLGSSKTPEATRKKFAQQRVDENVLAASNALNLSAPRLINDMVKSRAAAQSVPMDVAAQLVAVDLGLSIKDVEVKPGLAEETFGKTVPKNKTDQGTDDDAQPATEGLRPSPATQVPDGVYEINGNVFQVKDGAFVDLPEEN